MEAEENRLAFTFILLKTAIWDLLTVFLCSLFFLRITGNGHALYQMWPGSRREVKQKTQKGGLHLSTCEVSSFQLAQRGRKEILKQGRGVCI